HDVVETVKPLLDLDLVDPSVRADSVALHDDPASRIFHRERERPLGGLHTLLERELRRAIPAASARTHLGFDSHIPESRVSLLQLLDILYFEVIARNVLCAHPRIGPLRLRGAFGRRGSLWGVALWARTTLFRECIAPNSLDWFRGRRCTSAW